MECATNRAARDRLVSLVHLIYLVCLVEPDRPDEPDQPSPVSPISRVSLDYPGSNCEKLFAAGCSKSPSSKAAGESKPEAYPLGYVEDFDEPRTPLAGFFSILLEESALLEKVFVYDGGRFGRKLSPFLQQSFDIFPDKVRFKIDLIAGLLEP